MKKGKIYIGTSGWSYKHWKDVFYPEKMKATDYLTFYAGSFKISEINTSFYHLPKPKTIGNWIAKVPKGFKFCPKLSRYITHMKKLHDPEEPLQRFFGVFDAMQPFCGPVLIQLPPSLKFNPEIALPFFEELKLNYSQYDFALEIRHTSWLETEPLAILRKFKIAFVISQSNGFFPYAEEITAKNIYLRFHGPDALYASGYSPEQLNYYALKFKDWASRGHTIWAFFNNDVGAHAIKDARALEKLISDK